MTGMDIGSLIKPEEHRKLAATFFNETWRLLNLTDRSEEQDAQMIHCAHASRMHWELVGNSRNRAVGEWQIARVYTLLNRPEPALYHARRCLEHCEAEDLGDFDIAFAQEAMARAAAAANDRALFEQHFPLAEALGHQIAEEDDRRYFFQDLHSPPWFGLR